MAEGSSKKHDRDKLTVPVTAMIVFFADLLSKSWARAHLTNAAVQPLVPNIVEMTLTTNTGGAFGIGREFGWLMTVLALSLSIILVIWILKRETSPVAPTWLERMGMGFIMGGALGNLCDRFIQGQVTDFLQFTFIDFPVFNIADASIDIGLVLVLLSHFTGSRAVPRGSTQKPVTEPTQIRSFPAENKHKEQRLSQYEGGDATNELHRTD